MSTADARQPERFTVLLAGYPEPAAALRRARLAGLAAPAAPDGAGWPLGALPAPRGGAPAALGPPRRSARRAGAWPPIRT